MNPGLGQALADEITVLDMHTAGEPVRIVTSGYPHLAGATILDKRREAERRHDHLRRRLMLEPRGHGGMYGVIPVKPSTPEADLAVLFVHADGYSTMCGHATIAVARWALDNGLVPVRSADGGFTLECPCGLVEVFARTGAEGAPETGFVSVPAFADDAPRTVHVAGFGAVEVELAFGGAHYAILPASRLGLSFDRDSIAGPSAAAATVLTAARAQLEVPRSGEPDLDFLYGVILTDDARWPDPTRNICVFAAGQIDRSPTGSGVTARIALDTLAHGAPLNVERRFIGPTRESFAAAAVGRESQGERDTVRVRVAGQSFYTGRSTFLFQDSDPLRDGFLLMSEAAGPEGSEG